MDSGRIIKCPTRVTNYTSVKKEFVEKNRNCPIERKNNSFREFSSKLEIQAFVYNVYKPQK